MERELKDNKDEGSCYVCNGNLVNGKCMNCHICIVCGD